MRAPDCTDHRRTPFAADHHHIRRPRGTWPRACARSHAWASTPSSCASAPTARSCAWCRSLRRASAACVDPLALPDLGRSPSCSPHRASSRSCMPRGRTWRCCCRWPASRARCSTPRSPPASPGCRRRSAMRNWCARLLGHELSKAHTRTDWSRRPLSAEQIDYALDDVHYLLPLADLLQEQLDAPGAARVARGGAAQPGGCGGPEHRPRKGLAAPQGTARP